MPSGRNKVVFVLKYGLFCTVDPIGFKGSKTWVHEYGILFSVLSKSYLERVDLAVVMQTIQKCYFLLLR